MSNFKSPAVRDRAYLDSLRDEPCILTWYSNNGSDMAESVVPAHLRLSGSGGMGMKPGDNHALPLRQSLHLIQSGMPEIQFWHENITDDCLAEALVALAEKRYAKWKGDQ